MAAGVDELVVMTDDPRRGGGGGEGDVGRRIAADTAGIAFGSGGDAAFLRALATGRHAEIHAAAASDGDSRRICGYPPAYVALAAAAAPPGVV
ncbi:MAG TPA: hypothetical protein VNC50_20365, partial [Planctomycetia bacterium]|nr:hypothetical protein [Planctomycetia bacterium]